MRSIKVVLGLGFVVSLMMAVSVGSASATWDLCVNVGENRGTFESSKCAKAGAPKSWEWQEVTGKDRVTLTNPAGRKLTLIEMAERVRVACTGSGEGTVGAGNEDLVSEIKARECEFINKEHGPCEEGVAPTARAVNLPWKTTLELLSGRTGTWDLLTSDGRGEPGWDVECTVGGIFKVSNTCIGNAATKMKNNASNGTVEGSFEGEASGKANCENSIGGRNRESGLVEGITVTAAEGGNALKFLEP